METSMHINNVSLALMLVSFFPLFGMEEAHTQTLQEKPTVELTTIAQLNDIAKQNRDLKGFFDTVCGLYVNDINDIIVSYSGWDDYQIHLKTPEEVPSFLWIEQMETSLSTY